MTGKSRILGIDFGLKRIGLAISDEAHLIAFPVKTVAAGKTGKETLAILLREIEELEKERRTKIGSIVMGLPLHLSGDESPLSKEVRYISARLQEVAMREVILWDERMTTSRASSVLKESGRNRKERGDLVDPLAASLILDDYLKSKHGSK